MEGKENEGPVVDNTVEKQKIKKRPKKKFNDDGDNTVKVDLSKPKEATDDVTKVDLNVKPEETKAVIEEVIEEATTTVEVEKTEVETPVLEEITDEVEEVAVVAEEAIKESVETGKPLPENIEKLMSFMEDTGGDLNDYVKLNKDYSEMDNLTLLKEYYKESKPHLDAEEIGFLMEDKFSFDEDVDDEREIRKKKIAMKEQVADAKQHLGDLKSKYYEDIKMGSKLTSEQQKAIDFFNRYNKEEAGNKETADKQKSSFLDKTDKVFNDKFKGFEYNVGEKKYRFNVNNANEVKKTQGDINNFVKKFLNEDGEVSDAKGYHKSLYTAMNADAVAKHFYEQGQADAMKNSIASAKNIDMSPRQSHASVTDSSGMTVRALDNDTANYKFKINKKK
mgnify:CR=1 FL=1|jgi:hypothetical protein|tara:strand:- start:526 stop:1701 length:1176 start_codon:yes stop_codon:yes gene_type:complete